MTISKRTGVVLVALAVMACCSPSRADMIQLGGSGWMASWAGDDIAVNVVTADTASVTIEIIKTLQSQTLGQLPAATIMFIQTDPQAVDRIIVSQETVHNDTMMFWGEYRWILTPTANVAFNETASDWDVTPFTQVDWLPHSVVASGDINNVQQLVGVGPFTPQGDPGLVIDINTQSGSTVFGLKQVAVPTDIPLPEPVTLAVLVMGGGLVFGKSRRSRNRHFSTRGGKI